MEQITITRKEFRSKAALLGAERMKKAEEDPNMGIESCIVMTMMHATICAALELKLFGKETEEE